MDAYNYIDHVGYWLIGKKEYQRFSPNISQQVTETLLPGEYFYRIDSNNLYLVKLIGADGLSVAEIKQNQELEFTILEQLRENNNFAFAYLVQICIFSEGVSVGNISDIQKQVSALSRCYLLPWFVDLAEQKTTVHTGMPLGHFGLLTEDSPLKNPGVELPESLELEAVSAAPEHKAPIMAKSLPVVTYLIMGICIALGVYSKFSADPAVITGLGAKVNDLVANGEYWRLLSSMFLHFGIMHLAFNMLFLFTMGPGVEGLFGKLRFLVIFLLAGLLGSVASFAFTSAISAGASGALFGLLGAYLYFWLRNPKAGKQIGSTVVKLILYNLLFGIVLKVVDNWAHMGGLLGGFLAAAIVGLPGEKRLTLGKTAALLGFLTLVLMGFNYGVQQENFPQRQAFAVQRQVNEARNLLVTSQDYSGAEKILKEALQKYPASADLHYFMGVTYLVQGRVQDAQPELQRAVQLKPDMAQAQYYLGYTYTKLGRRSEAITSLSEAARLDSGNAEYQNALKLVKSGQPLP